MSPRRSPSEPVLAPTATAPREAVSDELEAAMRSLSGISTQLLDGYRTLERRAQRVEDDLVRANAELEGLLEALPCGVIVRDGAGRIVRANRAACALLGCAPGQLVGAAGHPALALQDSPETGREVRLESGARRVLVERWSPLPGTDGGSVGIIDDRTEVVSLAQRLHKLDKLAALGTMAAGVAHEIRNPMNAVRGFAALIAREAEPASRVARQAQRICAGVDGADAIIGNLLSLANPERLQLEELRAAELVGEAVALVVEAGGERARAAIETRVPDLRFRADRIKLRQALRNLLDNALQAQGAAARVRVEVAAEGGEIAFHVVDWGPGVPPELVDQIGDPFFTTRAEGHGLGLALVHTIAVLHGGRLQVCPSASCSHPGHAEAGGAHMSFRIPFQPVR